MAEKELPYYFQVLFGLIFFAVGLAIIFLSGDVSSTNEGELYVPGWISKLAGGLFSAGGILIINDSRLEWLNSLMFLYLISAFGLIFGWISLFGAAEGFGLNGRTGLNSFGVLVARFMFGGGALICAFLIVGAIVDQVIKLFKKSS